MGEVGGPDERSLGCHRRIATSRCHAIIRISDTIPRNVLVTRRCELTSYVSEVRVDGNVKGGEETEPRPEPRRWSTTVEIEGLAPSLAEISLFIDALVEMKLFRRVRLDHTREVEISERAMREFRVLFELRPDADIRIVENPSVHANAIEEDPS